VLYSLTETEIETEIYIISLSEMEMEGNVLCKTETKYKRKSEISNVIVIETKFISQRKWAPGLVEYIGATSFPDTSVVRGD